MGGLLPLRELAAGSRHARTRRARVPIPTSSGTSRYQRTVLDVVVQVDEVVVQVDEPPPTADVTSLSAGAATDPEGK